MPRLVPLLLVAAYGGCSAATSRAVGHTPQARPHPPLPVRSLLGPIFFFFLGGGRAAVVLPLGGGGSSARGCSGRALSTPCTDTHVGCSLEGLERRGLAPRATATTTEISCRGPLGDLPATTACRWFRPHRRTGGHSTRGGGRALPRAWLVHSLCRVRTPPPPPVRVVPCGPPTGGSSEAARADRPSAPGDVVADGRGGGARWLDAPAHRSSSPPRTRRCPFSSCTRARPYPAVPAPILVTRPRFLPTPALAPIPHRTLPLVGSLFPPPLFCSALRSVWVSARAHRTVGAAGRLLTAPVRQPPRHPRDPVPHGRYLCLPRRPR